MQESAPAAVDSDRGLLERVGMLRLGLAALVAILLAMAFLDAPHHDGWWVIPTQVAPGLAFLVIWILPFDMIMSRVFLLGSDKPDRARYRAIISLDSILLLALLISWGPFFYSLLR